MLLCLNFWFYYFLPSSWVYPRTRRTSNHLIPAARGGRDLRKCGRIIRKAWAGRGGWRILFSDQLYKGLTKDHPKKTCNHPEIINIKLLTVTEIWRTQLNKGPELQQPKSNFWLGFWQNYYCCLSVSCLFATRTHANPKAHTSHARTYAKAHKPNYIFLFSCTSIKDFSLINCAGCCVNTCIYFFKYKRANTNWLHSPLGRWLLGLGVNIWVNMDIMHM